MAFRLRLYPDTGHLPVLLLHRQQARSVWNTGLEQRGHAWSSTFRFQRMSVYDQKRSLTEARAAIPWLKAGSSVVQQQALFDLERAFQNWWSNPTHFGRPSWRKAGVHESFAVRDLKLRRLNRKWGEILIPKAGWVRFRVTRAWTDLLTGTSARASLDRAGRWWVSITAPQPVFQRETTGAIVGLDMGVTHSITTSDGDHYGMPLLLSPGEKRHQRTLERKMAKQQKGSNRRELTRCKLARIKARETDRRKNWVEQTTTRLVRDHDLIAVEDLRVKNMTRSASGTVEKPGRNVAQKRGLNRAIQNQAWGMCRTRLQNKADAATSLCEIVAVPPAYTSQRCSNCGHISTENRESQAVFCCTKCGFTCNADVNAGLNIRAAGLVVYGRGGQQKPVETSTSAPSGVKQLAQIS